MRGTQGTTDIADDVDLAGSGVPTRQVVSMVNWWLRLTAPTNAQAVQIQALYHVVPSIPTPTVVFDGYGAAPSVAGSGTLVGQSSIAAVNGHSLGGYLATAFTRLFGGSLGYNVQSVNTFNSAGFNNLQASNIANSYNQIAQLIGPSLGLGSFAAVAPKQTNNFGENGIEVTTNSWYKNKIPGAKWRNSKPCCKHQFRSLAAHRLCNTDGVAQGQIFLATLYGTNISPVQTRFKGQALL
jgi:hypothetical protein